ncbi:hypothetical protein ACHWQZ_G014577 [Mnemiopsis leidyi]
MGDILSNYVLYPLVLKITDSYYLYSLILPYIATLGSPIKDRKFFTQAKTYEDFIKKINKETDLTKLRQLRYKVIAEIMQAMTVENLKQEEDFDGLLSQINSKSYRLSTRNLARYINECKVAKVTCEKRIHDMTRLQKRAPHYADMRFRETDTKLLELDEILYSPYVLPFFVQFLEKQKDYGPLKLWLLIEQCRALEKRPEDMYPLIKQAYLDHLTVTSPLRAHQVSRHLIRMAEAYVEHKSGYWQFVYEIQDEIHTMLLEQHYKPFLISSQYMQYVCTTEGKRGTLQALSPNSPSRDRAPSVGSESTSDDFSKLSALKEELKSKEVLLETLDIMNYCSVEELNQLQEEIQNLRVTINQLEHHSERMTLWWQFIGRWEATVEDVEASSSSEILYTVLVKQKKQSCHQILPFNKKSKFKLTQFNLNPAPQQPASLLCICAKRGRRSKRSASQISSRSGSSTSAAPSLEKQASFSENNNSEGEPSSTHRETKSVKLNRADSRSSYDSLAFENSYLSLRPHSMLLSNTSTADTISINSNLSDTGSQSNGSRNSTSGDSVSLMFTPDPGESSLSLANMLASQLDTDKKEIFQESDILSQPVEVGNSLFYRRNSIEVGNSVFYRQSSLCSKLLLQTDQPALSSAENLSVASESTLSGTIVSEQEELGEDLETDSLPLESISLDEIPTHSDLSLKEPPPVPDDISTISLREFPPPLDSDEDTISVTSQDLPANFMFDDVFCGENNSNSELPSPETTSLEDTPSTKVRRFLSLHTDIDTPLPANSNQSDDEKIKNLNRSGSAMSNTTSISIEEEEVCSDSSFEDPDPYLVVDIQSLPSQYPAPQLTEGSTPRTEVRDEEDEEEECLLHRLDEEEEEVQTGWVITHTLEDLKSLYLNLKGCKSAGYPSSFPVTFPKQEMHLLESKEHVGDFLNFVLRDKTLSQSEHVYRFFNPSCEQLYRSTQSKQKGDEQTEDKNKDSIAIPFYTLLGEIFEIHGHLQWLRRQIIYLVRITFGSTIERQIYRAMNWAGSEQQVFWYVQCFKTSMWGDLPANPELEDPVKREHLRGRVRMSLLNTPPHLLNVLFGANKTRKGLAKILDTMEVRAHAKNCVYTIVELLLLHLIGTEPDCANRMKVSFLKRKD